MSKHQNKGYKHVFYLEMNEKNDNRSKPPASHRKNKNQYHPQFQALDHKNHTYSLDEIIILSKEWQYNSS